MGNYVKWSDEDDCFVAEYHGLMAHGDTREEALEELVDAVSLANEAAEIDWEFIEDPPDQSSSDDDWYALHEGGYLKPEAILVDPEQVIKVREAEAILASFFEAVRDAEIRTEM